jgi:hypothetical protein
VFKDGHLTYIAPTVVQVTNPGYASADDSGVAAEVARRMKDCDDRFHVLGGDSVARNYQKALWLFANGGLTYGDLSLIHAAFIKSLARSITAMKS